MSAKLLIMGEIGQDGAITMMRDVIRIGGRGGDSQRFSHVSLCVMPSACGGSVLGSLDAVRKEIFGLPGGSRIRIANGRIERICPPNPMD